jgi:hypothetical protein
VKKRKTPPASRFAVDVDNTLPVRANVDVEGNQFLAHHPGDIFNLASVNRRGAVNNSYDVWLFSADGDCGVWVLSNLWDRYEFVVPTEFTRLTFTGRGRLCERRRITRILHVVNEFIGDKQDLSRIMHVLFAPRRALYAHHVERILMGAGLQKDSLAMMAKSKGD